MISSGLIIAWLHVRVLPAPPRSSAQMRFPEVSRKTPGFPRHSRRPERHFRSLHVSASIHASKTCLQLSRSHRSDESCRALGPGAASRPHVRATSRLRLRLLRWPRPRFPAQQECLSAASRLRTTRPPSADDCGSILIAARNLCIRKWC
jgi:hypothetical protein